MSFLQTAFSRLAINHVVKPHSLSRTITISCPLSKKQMPPRPGPVDESEFTEVFLHGSGPGGQKINKTSSAVQLKHLATGTVLKVQATRSRTQNRKLARQMLADKLDDMKNGDKSRNAIVGEVKKRKKSSSEKKKRRKYKLLDEEKRVNNAGAGAHEQDQGGSSQGRVSDG